MSKSTMHAWFFVSIVVTLCLSPSVSSGQQPTPQTNVPSESAVIGYADFGYRDRSATGIAATKLAKVDIYLQEPKTVFIRAETSATTLDVSKTNVGMGISVNGLPQDPSRPDLPKAARFVTVTRREWTPCATSCVLQLEAGDHTIYWYASSVEAGTVVFDAGLLSVQAFSPNQLAPGLTAPKRALLVGINKYKAVQHLQGCENDVEDMRNLLMNEFGFAESDIRTLINEQATSDEIIKNFNEHLVAQSDGNTVALFYFSGHGSQMTDADGDETEDRKDETIVTYDSRTPGHYDLCDDDIKGLLTSLSKRTPFITFMFDSCHSGTAEKFVGSSVRSVKEDDRSSPPIRPFAVSSKGIQSETDRKYVFISGCRDREVSHEYYINGRHRGALTYFFTREVRMAQARNVTYRDIMGNVIKNVNLTYRDQTPTVDGPNVDSTLFRAPVRVRSMTVPVNIRDGRFSLPIGWLNQATEGSIYDLYLAEDNDLQAGKAITQLRLSAVDALESQAEISGAVPPSGKLKAVERFHKVTTQLTPVYLDVEGTTNGNKTTSKTLRQFLEKWPEFAWFKQQFRVVKKPDEARLVLSETSDHTIAISDGSMQIDESKDKVDADDFVENFRMKLEKWGKWIELVHLDVRPSSTEEAFAPISLVVIPNMTEHGEAKLSSSPLGSDMTLFDDEVFRIKVEMPESPNVDKSKVPDVFIAIYSLNGDGSVTLLPKDTVKSQRLGVGQVRTIAVKHDPKRFFGKRDRDIVKLIVTNAEFDASALTQGPARDISKPELKIIATKTVSLDFVPNLKPKTPSN